MNKIISILSMIVLMLDASAQTFDLETEASLEMKYWAYRYRFLGDDFDRNLYPGFIALGEGQGFSIPASTRNLSTDSRWGYYDPSQADYMQSDPSCTNQQYVLYDPYNPNNPHDMGEIKWGDNPLIEIGKYLGVLATEWKLLNASGDRQNELAATEQEIYYVFSALERLDLNGEDVYGLTPEYNSFFARDDVPEDFTQWHFGNNYDFTESISSCTAGPNNSLGNDGCNHYWIFGNVPDESIQRNAMSADEVLGLLVGLRLIVACLPEGIVVNGRDLRIYAWDKIVFSVWYLKNNNWVIKDPHGNLVCRGALTFWAAFPLCKMYRHMTGTNIEDNISDLCWFIWNYLENNFDGSDYEICYDLTVGLPELFDALGIGDLLPQICFGIDSKTNNTMILEIAALSSTWNPDNLDGDCYRGNKAIFSLMSSFLDGRDPNDPPANIFNSDAYNYWLNYLNSFYAYFNKDNDGNVITNPPSHCFFYPSESVNIYGSEYEENGLDYMLAFNLFKLVFHGDFPYYLGNLINREDYATYPLTLNLPNGSSITVGNDANPITHYSLDTYYLDGKFDDGAHVTFIAQNEIVHGPDFDFIANDLNSVTEIEMYPATFDCRANYYELPSNTQLVFAKQSGNNNTYSSITISNNHQQLLAKDLSENKFFIFPNPSNKQCTIEIKNTGNYNCLLTDIFGKVIFLDKIQGDRKRIDISSLPPGFYNVKLSDDSGIIGVEQLIVQ